MTLDELIAAYRREAIAHGRGLEDGNSRRCNRAHDALAGIRDQLRQSGPQYQDALLALLDDDNASVRSWAAMDVLQFSPEDGVRVLREVASGPRGMVRLDAEMVLERWQAGEWHGDSRDIPSAP